MGRGGLDHRIMVTSKGSQLAYGLGPAGSGGGAARLPHRERLTGVLGCVTGCWSLGTSGCWLPSSMVAARLWRLMTGMLSCASKGSPQDSTRQGGGTFEDANHTCGAC